MMPSYDDDSVYEERMAQKLLDAVFENPTRSDEAKVRFEMLRHKTIAAASAVTVAHIMKAYCPNGEAVPYETLLELYNRYEQEAKGW